MPHSEIKRLELLAGRIRTERRGHPRQRWRGSCPARDVPEAGVGCDDWLGTTISNYKHEFNSVKDKDEESYACHHRVDDEPSHKYS